MAVVPLPAPTSEMLDTVRVLGRKAAMEDPEFPTDPG